jgi:PAS domain S-box-containing protein
MANSKILIVEDDNIVAKDLQKRLTHLGYDVIGVALTGEEAIKKAIANLPDLVLMEVCLKGEMNGIETAKALRFQYGIAVVYLSSNADSDTLKRASKTEPFGYILKPFEERELNTAIEVALYRRELERRFKENDAYYGTTLRSIGEAVIATDVTGSIKFMNAAAENLTGWKMNEVLGETLLKVFRTTDASAKQFSANPVDQILKNKITAVLKNHAILVSREGKELPIDESASPIKDELGNIVGVVLVFQDVTDRKRVQEALKTSQEYAQSIINSSMDMVIAVDLERRIVEFNKAAEITFGYKKEELIGKHVNILYADPEAGSRINKRVDESGREITEVWNKRKNGEVFQCLLSSAVLRNSRGEKIGYMGTSRDITEIKRAEDILKAAQEYAQSIVHSSLDMIIAVDKDRNLNEFNKAAEETFGYTMKEVLGKSVDILFADPAEGMKVHKTTVEQGRHVQEVLNKRKNGELFQSLLSSSVLQNTKSEMIGVMGISRDITEKKRADQALHESEERYRALVELSPDPIAVHVDGKVVFVNTAAVQVFAANSVDDLVGLPILKLVHPDYRMVVKDRIQQMTHEGKRVPTIEEKFLRLDGTSFEAEVAAMSFLWKGKPAVQVVLRDVSERRKAEIVIRGSEAKYRSLVENVLDGVYQTTPDGEILTANPAMARMLGYDSETDLLLLNVERDLYINSEERRQYLKLLNQAERVKNAEFRLRGKDGQIITVLENARVVRSKIGDILYYEGTMTDITELKVAQEALRISEERSRAFIEQSAEAIWCFESPEPMSIHISEERQIRHMMEVGFLTECNDAMARMYGIDHAEQLLGAKLKNLFDPSDPANIEYLRTFIRSNYKLVNAESHETDKDGNRKYFLNNMIGVVEGGYLIRTWGTQRDITVEKQAEHRLLESEEKYRTLTETVACAIFIFTDDKILYMNPASENISGYSKEELLGMKLWDIVHPEFREMIRERALIRLKGGNLPSRSEVKIITKSGEERWIDVAAGMTSYHGKPAVLATAFDITEQKHGKIEENQVGNFIAKANGIIIECNPAFVNLLGFKTRDDVMHAQINIYDNSKHKQDGLLKCLRKTSSIHKYELKLRNYSGHTISIIADIVTMKDDDGALRQIQGTVLPKKKKK